MGTQAARTSAPRRRTVTIRGLPEARQAKVYDFPLPGPIPPTRRRPRPARSAYERPVRRASRRPQPRVGSRPDRIAFWAVLMGLFMVLVAVATAHP